MKQFKKVPSLLTLITALSILQCFPQECPECDQDNKAAYEYEIISANTQPALASNLIAEISYDSLGDRLLISTQAGGFSILDNTSIFTTATDPTISSNNILSSAGQSKILTSTLGSNGTSYIDYFDATTWNKSFANSTITKYSKIIFNGTSFFVLEDKRIDENLSLDIPATTVQSSLHLVKDYSNTLGVGTNVIRNVDHTQTNIDAISMQGQAIVDIDIDKDNDIIALGYTWLNSNEIKLGLFRYLAADLNNKNTGTAIDPIIFGQAWETPTALAYNDRSVNSSIIEDFYLATKQGLYQLEVNGYSSIFSVVRYYFDGTSWVQGNAISSIIINSMTVIGGNLWMATNKGISILRADFEILNTTNSSLPSNNVFSIASFGGFIYAATDAGLIKIKEIAIP